jgi:hypothetical protein
VLGLFDMKALTAMEAEIALEVVEAWSQAQVDVYPPLSAVTSRVFASGGACND